MVRRSADSDPRGLGEWGEGVASQHLEDRGYRIRERNYRCRHGEIDIIAEKDESIIFIEVKTRSGRSLGEPFEAVSPAKVRKLREMALRYLAETNVRHRDVRFDVISIVGKEGVEKPELNHMEAAF